MGDKSAPGHCRLCGAEGGTYRFSAVIMDTRKIAYFECPQCGSLQTEAPVWLDEAYSLHLGSEDCGAVQRNLDNAVLCLLVARLWGLRDAYDHGGGDGMLTRLVRDYGINCFLWDKYAEPVYAQGFTEPDFTTLEMLFSFEVFEHFDEPSRQLQDLFDRRPNLLLVSTGAYRGQGADWSYLSLKSGRHIFFYSPRAMDQIAERYGYRATVQGQYILFLRADVASGWRLALFKALARRSMMRVLRSVLLSRHPFGAGRDRQTLRRRAAEAKGAVQKA